MSRSSFDVESSFHDALLRRLGSIKDSARGVGTKVRVDEKPTLAEAGIDKNLANRPRKLNALSAADLCPTTLQICAALQS
jgi:hypothetical protein